jgi:hypothetical protein
MILYFLLLSNIPFSIFQKLNKDLFSHHHLDPLISIPFVSALHLSVFGSTMTMSSLLWQTMLKLPIPTLMLAVKPLILLLMTRLQLHVYATM